MSEAARHPELDLSSWVFWRKRLARVLVVAGVAWGAAHLLVTLPQDQNVVFQGPSEHELKRVTVTYRQAREKEALGGARWVLPRPSNRTSHVFRLPKGQYTFSVSAETTDLDGNTHLLKSAETVQLQGGTTQIALPSARP